MRGWWGGGVVQIPTRRGAHLSDRRRRPRGSPSPSGSEHDLDLLGGRYLCVSAMADGWWREREEGKPRRVEVVMEERWAVRLCERASKADFGFLCWNRYCHFVCSCGSHYWFSEKGVNLDYFFEKYSIDTNAHNTYIHSTLYMHVHRTTISISEGQSG